MSVEVGFRAAAAVALPLLVLLAVGRLDLAAYATFGAFTALYGRNEPYRLRLRSVSVAGAALLVSMVSTAVGLAMIGIGTSLFTGRSMLFSIGRQFGITTAAAAITYAVGHLLGVVLAG